MMTRPRDPLLHLLAAVIVIERNVFATADNGEKGYGDVTAYDSNGQQQAGGTCTDTPNWSNGNNNFHCADYESKGFCANGAVVPKHQWTVGSKFNHPERNCCVCGKSPQAPAPAPAPAPKPTHGQAPAYDFTSTAKKRCNGTAYTDNQEVGCNGWSGLSPVQCQLKCKNNEQPPNCPANADQQCVAAVLYSSGWCHLYSASQCRGVMADPSATVFSKKPQQQDLIHRVKRAVGSPMGQKIVKGAAVVGTVAAVVGGVAAAINAGKKHPTTTTTTLEPTPGPTPAPTPPQTATPKLRARSQPPPQTPAPTPAPAPPVVANSAPPTTVAPAAVVANSAPPTTVAPAAGNTLAPIVFSSTPPPAAAIMSTQPPLPLSPSQGPAHTTLARAHNAGATSLDVVNQALFRVGDQIWLDLRTPQAEVATITAFSSIILKQPLKFAHGANGTVDRKAGPATDQPQPGSSSSGNSSLSGGLGGCIGLLLAVFICCFVIACAYQMFCTRRNLSRTASTDSYEEEDEEEDHGDDPMD